jgi:hypothetical protein
VEQDKLLEEIPFIFATTTWWAFPAYLSKALGTQIQLSLWDQNNSGILLTTVYQFYKFTVTSYMLAMEDCRLICTKLILIIFLSVSTWVV